MPPKYSTDYIQDILDDSNQDHVGLDLSRATPRVLQLIEKWAKKQEALAVAEERYEDAAGYRDLLKNDRVTLRRVGRSFFVVPKQSCNI